MKGFLLAMAMILFVMTGCQSSNAVHDEELFITEILNSDLSRVRSIVIRFGDGNRMTLMDDEGIREIMSQLRKMKVRAAADSGVGYLYSLELEEGNVKYEISNTLAINGRSYKAVVDSTLEELNKLIIGKGREAIPGLLPGIEIH